MLMGGRGAGKTRAGAEWVRRIAAESSADQPVRIALVGETYSDAREVMIEGASGLRAICYDAERPHYEVSRRRLVWPEGAIAYCFSAEDPDGLRGYQFDAAWADELCKWRYAEETWSNLQLALRLGDKPRQVVTTTPRPAAIVKRLLQAKTTAVSRATSYANRENLSDAFFTEVVGQYEGTRLGRQELMGELVEGVEGALWSWSMIDAHRISLAPDLDRIVVAIDPPITSGPDADECGIIIAGKTIIRDVEIAFVLSDWSQGGLTPRGWSERAVAAYHEYQADAILIEANQGGEMGKQLLHQVDPSLPVKPVHATRGKRLRAEPVAALYEMGRVRHVGAFSALEDQMTRFTGQLKGEKSPDRLDALVWALTDLLVKKKAANPAVRTLK